MKPVILDDTLSLGETLQVYSNTDTGISEMSNNGLGPLDCISAIVHEERNGAFTATIEASLNSNHIEDIHVGGIVALRTPQKVRQLTNISDGYQNTISNIQMFRIYKLTKHARGTVSIELNHITYDLNYLPASIGNYTNSADAFGIIIGEWNYYYDNHFNGLADFQVNTAWSNAHGELRSKKGTLAGYEGSLVDTYNASNRGEFEWNNINCWWLKQRGSNRGYTIEYGKNLIDLKLDEQLTFRPTGIQGYAVCSTQPSTLTYIPDTKVSDIIIIKQSTAPRIMFVDFSDKITKNDWANEDGNHVPNKLTTLARNYITKYNLGEESLFNLDINFIELEKQGLYDEVKHLEEVYLCDTVTVKYPKFNLNAQVKVIGYEYDSLHERYNSINLGTPKLRFEDVVAKKASNQAYYKVLGTIK